MKHIVDLMTLLEQEKIDFMYNKGVIIIDNFNDLDGLNKRRVASYCDALQLERIDGVVWKNINEVDINV